MGENMFIILARAFFSHLFMCFYETSELLRTSSEIRSPPSPGHRASEENMEESPHRPVFLPVLRYLTRLGILLPVLLRATNTICNRNHSAHHELKDSKPWTQRLSKHVLLRGASLN